MGESRFDQVETVAALHRRIADVPALLAYFSTPGCNVCRVLAPKLGDLVATDFPRLDCIHVDCALHPSVAAAFSVFAVPTILVFFDGREWLREGRYLALGEFKNALSRPYELIFGSDRSDSYKGVNDTVAAQP